MKIGILSMQMVPNYGSILQALALKTEMERRGHDVYFVDILPGRQVVTANAAAFDPKSKFDKYMLRRIENLLLERRMRRIFEKDRKTLLAIDKILPKGERFDLVIIGSDEVFNAATPSPWGFSTQLFGDVPNANRVVTYAASCGGTTLEKVRSLGIDKDIAAAMRGLDAVSVRDRNTYDFVTALRGEEPLLHLDPVFLGDYTPFIGAAGCKPRRKPYLLVYAYSNRIQSPDEIAAIRKYAAAHRLEILCVGTQQRWCAHNIPASTPALLRYVQEAACVLTDTFHGTVFSMKYNKRFAVLVRDSNREKLGFLLAQFGMTSRIVEQADKLADVMDAPLDFACIKTKIAEEQKRSAAYLDAICEAAVCKK